MSKKKDVRGQIVRSLNPEKSGFTERGHLEGRDAFSAVPPHVRQALRRAVDSGELDIKVSDEPNEDGEWVVDIST